ncbi:MAG: reductive dehalogenase, partial [Rhodospirillales bacterium]|nr:reductive dehalogenase [Rhodospirillales bacterium]
MDRRSTVGNKSRMEEMGLDSAPDSDLDGVMSSQAAEWKRSWWVQEVKVPTLEVDWQATERFDATKIQQVSWQKYIGEDRAKELNKRRAEKYHQWMLDNRPGYSLRDRALEISSYQSGAVGTSFTGSWTKFAERAEIARKEAEEAKARGEKPKPPTGGRAAPQSPEELGVPRWEGKPEENARMLRSALRHFGADQVGYVELNEQTRKLIYAVDVMDGKRIEFENVEKAYETKEKRVIPDGAKWVVVFSIKMSEELIKRKSGIMPSALSSAATQAVYAAGRNTIDRLQNFLHVLGYQGLMGNWYNGLGIAPAFGVMAGLGELSRTNRMISPEYGPLQRVFKIVTDLPLEPTKPIDAGIMNF